MAFKMTPVFNKPAASYEDQMRQQWQTDPKSVDQTWQEFFSGTGAAVPNGHVNP